jgi:hypothetical protein
MAYDDWDSEGQRRERQRRRKVIADWKIEAKAVRDADPGKRMLLRESRRESLRRKEDAARTIDDFEQVKILWDNLEIVERYRLGKREEQYDDELPDTELSDLHTIIPAPFNHVWWRQLLGGNFLDVIYDCPHEIAEQTTSRPVYDYTSELDEMHTALLYYWAIRQWSPQRIATFWGKTDRNIRKVYNIMMDDIRVKMYVRLNPRYVAGAPLTITQWKFCRTFWDRIDEKQKGRIERKIDRERRRQDEKRREESKRRDMR